MQNNRQSGVSIIGAGKLGGALAIALEKCGYQITALATRNLTNAANLADFLTEKPQLLTAQTLDKLLPSRIIFISTPDPQIRLTADYLAALESIKHEKPFFFHTSGALSSEVLTNLRAIGCRVASFHPLVSISDAKLGSTRFAGAFFCLEGDAEAVNLAQEIVGNLGGKSFAIEAAFKTLYHASAVTASGHLVALFATAIEMLQKCGLEPEKAREILFPLIKSTVENLAVQTPERALTGTFARADLPTMQRHLAAIQTLTTPEILAIYAALGLRSIELAQKNGADTENLRRMNQILEDL